jgi:hypothetical protein
MKKCLLTLVLFLFLLSYLPAYAINGEEFIVGSGGVGKGGGGEDLDLSGTQLTIARDCSYTGYNCGMSYDPTNSAINGCLCQYKTATTCYSKFRPDNPTTWQGKACVTVNGSKYCTSNWSNHGVFSSFQYNCTNCYASWLMQSP